MSKCISDWNTQCFLKEKDRNFMFHSLIYFLNVMMKLGKTGRRKRDIILKPIWMQPLFSLKADSASCLSKLQGLPSQEQLGGVHALRDQGHNNDHHDVLQVNVVKSWIHMQHTRSHRAVIGWHLSWMVFSHSPSWDDS